MVDKEMQAEVEESEGATEKEEEAPEVDDLKVGVGKSDGKLVMAEEIAVGHVGWTACQCHVSLSISSLIMANFQ